MQEYKYRDLFKSKVPDWGWELKDFRSECLRPVADGFLWNLVRTSTFALFPAWIALEAIREQLWLDHSIIASGREISPDLSRWGEDEYSPEIEREYDRLVNIYRKLPKEQIRRFLADIGVGYIEHRLGIPGQEAVPIGVEALFSTIIIESWTTFETLARELWVVALDEDDGTINSRVQVAGVLQKPRKRIKPTFNPKTHQGSFQSETRQVTFQRLEDIKKLYSAALGQPAEAAFNLEDGYIDVLNAFRNVIVHKRGKADSTFCDQVANFPEYKSVSEGEGIPLDGHITNKMRDAGMYVGRKLIQLLDAELLRQKTTN